MTVKQLIGTFADVKLICPTDAVAEHVAEYCDPNEVVQFEYPVSHDLWHLPVPADVSLPEVRLNVLHWPTDASMFATCYVLVEEWDLATVRAACFTAAGPAAQTLSLAGDDESITASMYALPPRPLARIANGLGEPLSGLWLVPLVDKRYFWWQKSADITVTEGTTTWAQLFSAIATALGETITVSSVPAAYSTPSARLNSYRQPLPLLLDAAARLVGMRAVRRLDGTVRVESVADATTVQDAQIALITSRSKRSGGAFRVGETKRSVPATVTVAFPRKDNGSETARQVHTADVTLASLALSEYTASGNVSDASDAEPIVITTSAAHGLSTGDVVDIASVGGNLGADGTWAVTVLSATTFSLDNSYGDGAYTSGGTWTATITGLASHKQTIFADLNALFTSAGGATPTNNSALNTLATQAATDWYKWRAGTDDYQFNGIVNWVPNGTVCGVEWQFWDGRVSTRTLTDPYNDAAAGLPWPNGMLTDPDGILTVVERVCSEGRYTAKLANTFNLITGGSGVWQSPGVSVTVPAGKWTIFGDVSTELKLNAGVSDPDNAHIKYRLYDVTAGAAVADSQRMGVQSGISIDRKRSNATYTWMVVPTVQTTYRLESMFDGDAGAVALVGVADVKSNTDGWTWLFAEPSAAGIKQQQRTLRLPENWVVGDPECAYIQSNCCPPGGGGGGGSGSGGGGDVVMVDICGGSYQLPSIIHMTIANNTGGGSPGTSVGCATLYGQSVAFVWNGDTTNPAWNGYYAESGSTCAIDFTLYGYAGSCTDNTGYSPGVGWPCLRLRGFLTFAGGIGGELIDSFGNICYIQSGYSFGASPSFEFRTNNDTVAQAGRYIFTA